MAAWKRTTTPDPCLTLEDLKSHLRVEIDDDDPVVSRMLATATSHVEAFLSRQLMPATFVLKLDGFPACDIALPRPPLASVTSIEYVDIGGQTQLVSPADYTVDDISEPGRIRLAYGASWPSTLAVEQAVTITYVAGYADADSIPPDILQAIRETVTLYYEERGETGTETLPRQAEGKLWTHRVGVFGGVA